MANYRSKAKYSVKMFVYMRKCYNFAAIIRETERRMQIVINYNTYWWWLGRKY